MNEEQARRVIERIAQTYSYRPMSYGTDPRIPGRSSLRSELGPWFDEALSSTEKTFIEYERRRQMYGAPPVPPQSSEQRGELSRARKTRSLTPEEKSQREESKRHKITFDWTSHTRVTYPGEVRQEETIFFLVKMHCSCGWVGSPARGGRGPAVRDDTHRVLRHFQRTQVRVRERQWVTRSL